MSEALLQFGARPRGAPRGAGPAAPITTCLGATRRLGARTMLPATTRAEWCAPPCSVEEDPTQAERRCGGRRRAERTVAQGGPPTAERRGMLDALGATQRRLARLVGACRTAETTSIRLAITRRRSTPTLPRCRSVGAAALSRSFRRRAEPSDAALASALACEALSVVADRSGFLRVHLQPICQPPCSARLRSCNRR